MRDEDANAPRALATFVPLTSESRGSRYEVTMPRVPFLKLQSFANVQALGTAGYHELTEKRGRFEPVVLDKIRDAIRFALDL